MIMLASGNEHKRRELQAILGVPIGIPKDRGLDFDPEEDGSSFLENALIKARALHELTGEAVIADDSGICVDALGGAPGIHSARYGYAEGLASNDAERNALLLSRMEGQSDRKARFVCCMVLLLSHERFFVAQETFEGEIAPAASGGAGFGYDPLLHLPAHGCTVAELAEDEKNRLSHRAKAARVLSDIIHGAF